jgi:hypothetical protein
VRRFDGPEVRERVELQQRVGSVHRFCAWAACKVFISNIAIVIGPTPPGTGVIRRARSAAAA